MMGSQPSPPRQRFPTRKQAFTIFFATLALSFTTCTSLIIVFGERQLSDAAELIVGVAVYMSIFAPVVAFIILIVYFVRARAERRRRKGER